MPGSFLKKCQFAMIVALTLLTTQPAAPGVSAQSSAKQEEPERRLVINIPSRTLWVYSGDQIIKYFPVGVGRVGYMTPLGKFQIIRKVLDPGWENPYLPSGKVRLAPGEDNPLGTRWMGFYQKDGGEYGMHGTDNPASVGKFSSHGCVRMKVSDAETLFDMITVGTPVDIVYEPVLIRRNGNMIRLVVYADRFKRGMPSAQTVKANILKQYPNAILEMGKIEQALRLPTERPVEVGVLGIDTEEIVKITAPSTTQSPAVEALPASLVPIESIPKDQSQQSGRY